MVEKYIGVFALFFGCTIIGMSMYLFYDWMLRRNAVEAAADEAVSESEAPDQESNPIETAPLVVEHLNQGMATLVVKRRPVKKLVTAHLIIWASEKKKRKKARRIEDSYYDLGIFEADRIGDQLIAEAIELAKSKLDELAKPAKQEASEAAAVEMTTPDEMVVPAVQQEESPVQMVSIEENEKPVDTPIKLIRHPSVYRGKILEVGYMPKVCKEGVRDCFGVRYLTQEGIEDKAWGVELREALRNANAGVGDYVEIIKIGRRTMEKGKVPMNLYQAAKLLCQPQPAACS